MSESSYYQIGYPYNLLSKKSRRDTKQSYRLL